MPVTSKAQLVAQNEALRNSLSREVAKRKRLERERVRVAQSSQGAQEDQTAQTRQLTAALGEALEQQTATAEIMRVISGSPMGIQPTFDAIARAATRLCEADLAGLFRFDGDLIHFVAQHGRTPEEIEAAQRAFPQPPRRHSVTARAILAATVVQIADVSEEPELEDALRIFRTVLAVPLIRDGRPLGAITVARRVVKPFTDRQIALLQTFADQAVIALENVRLFTELQEKNRALTEAHSQISEALEQQTATSEILRVISSSPTNVQPVFDTILANALRLCEAHNGGIFTFDGQGFRMAAAAEISDEFLHYLRDAVVLPGPETPLRRVGLEPRVSHVADILADPSFSPPEVYRREGMRTSLAVPMVKEGRLVGAFAFHRRHVRPFTEKQIALITTFADQAVIAIENVRLFKELEARNRDLTEALDQQTATAEILRVIGTSPMDTQPVFDGIARSGVRVCGAHSCALFVVDGNMLRVAATHGVPAERVERFRMQFPVPLSAENDVTQVLHERRIFHLVDIEHNPAATPQHIENARLGGYRTRLMVPMMRGDSALGLIAVTHQAPTPFPDQQVALLKTFADQAVIAIENVRLFKELEARNRDLTEALDRQTATAEILRVISQSQTELQPVFDAIADNAMRLFRAWGVGVLQSDGQLFHFAASRGGLPGSEKYLRERSPWVISEDRLAGRCIAERAILHIPDIESDPTVDQAARDLGRARGWRSVLQAPMLRDGQSIGVISISRVEAGRFSPAEMELLQTFADQAVIAIENARLLGELQARTGELTRSVGELKALGEVGQAVSSTLDLETVLTTVVSRATQLTGMDSGVIYEYDEEQEQFRLRATQDLEVEIVETLRATPVRTGEGVTGRMAVTREPVQIPDITQGGAYQSHVRDLLLGAGYRALLAVPLLREDHLLGGLVVNRKSAGEFPAEVVELLKTFATQSALAIQNARLFREIEAKSRELEAASRHKSEFLANMSHELRTPLNAIIGFSEILLERMFGEMNDKQDEYLRDILESGRHLLSLINDILDLSKVEAGRMELEVTDFDLPQAIENALILVRERAARRGIALHQTVAAGLDRITGDERKIKQVLLNLLSNAIKFTPEGGRIDIRASLADGGLDVSVGDTGVGIAPEEQGAVFEEFRQVGSSAGKQEGTGLGLALCRKFVELHGGRIWVESEVGRGSTFTFRLPVEP